VSKRSQQEARQKKEMNEQERRLRYLSTLSGYLNTCAHLYRQELTVEAVGAYETALRDLGPEQLKIAFDEAMRVCQFFPNPAEILAALKAYHDRQPMNASTGLFQRPKQEPLSPEFKKIWKAAWDKIKRQGSDAYKHRTMWKVGDTWYRAEGNWVDRGGGYWEFESEAPMREPGED
jgi:hypothetical protein